jgi:hypothetical protein
MKGFSGHCPELRQIGASENPGSTASAPHQMMAGEHAI